MYALKRQSNDSTLPENPHFQKIVGRLTPPLLFLFGVPSRNRRLSAAGWGAGSSCGGLGGKAGPQPTRIPGIAIAAAATRHDTNETAVVIVLRGTKAPPNRRGDGGVIICNLGVTSFVIIILKLVILFVLIGIASCAKDFKLGKIE